MEEAAEITFYNILRKNFSEEDASKLVALQKQMQTESLATKTDLAQAETRIKSTLTWRMFIFWIGQVAATVAIVRYAM